jgi:Zn-dependent peptidase ImmA (M78 family)
VAEREADTFAALFLLPEKRVIAAFKSKFLECPLHLNEQTAFALMSQDVESVRMKCRTLRDLTRVLSSAVYYNGLHFLSLADQFGVSIEAMAIRLEELKLVQF